MYYLLPHLPRRRCCILHLCLQWLRHRAIWVVDQYSSWALPPHLRVSGVSGAWNGDWHALDYHRQSISPPGHQCSDECRHPPPSLPSVPPATPPSPSPPSPPPSPRSEQPSQFSHCVCVSGWLHPAPCFFLFPPCLFIPFSCRPGARHYQPPASGVNTDGFGNTGLLLVPAFPPRDGTR